MENGQDMTCEQAQETLRAILDSEHVRMVCTLHADNPTDELAQQRFTFLLRAPVSGREGLVAGEWRISGEWFCGSEYALSAFHKAPWTVSARGSNSRKALLRAATADANHLCVDDAELRKIIRRSYRPSIVDVVASLLCDAASIESAPDWVEWADSMGVFRTESASGKPRDIKLAVRAAQRDYLLIQERAGILRRMLGSQYTKALECARSF